MRKAQSVCETLRCSVPQQHLETYDSTPLRRKLLAMKNSIKENGNQAGRKFARKQGAGGAGSGNNGNGMSVYGIINSEGEETAPRPAEPGCQADLNVLLSEGISLSELKDRIEKRCIEQAMAMSGGNISKAAAFLGMKRPRLSQLVKHYKLGNFKKN
jgi:DNA-binding NtrC family response regulator